MQHKPSQLTHEQFMEIYGGIYEHSPWVAEGAWSKRQGANLDSIHTLAAAMQQAVAEGNEAQQLSLIRAHPDLAPAQGTELTAASQSEQAKAGLKQCSPEEFAEFQRLNTEYKAKFGFPFIIAVRGHTRHSILEAFRLRIRNEKKAEFQTALDQINRIAGFRLSDMG